MVAKMTSWTKQRIWEFIRYKRLSKQEFFRRTGLKRGFLDADKLDTSIPDTFIATIITAFPELNLEWLITGEGSMQKVPIITESEYKEKYYELLEKYNSMLESLTQIDMKAQQIAMKARQTVVNTITREIRQ